jgi:deoxyribonuclease-4
MDAIMDYIDGDEHIKVLIKYLMYGETMGAKGVVVHVGKHTSQTPAAGLEQMRKNIRLILKFATPECPLLLETPAGQGTELLTALDEFAAFVKSFGDDPRFGVCVDTCHVFATGCDPVAYLKGMVGTNTRLIHFNDSATPCGSRLDRHAYCGQGHIGLPKMTEVAEFGSAAAIPMLIE